MAHENAQAPIVQPDHVRGVMGQANTRVDRHFYLFDEVTDLVYEADGYAQPRARPDDPERWMIILLCPCCGQGLRIDTDKKKISIDERGLETDQGDPVRCTYFLDKDGYKGWCPFKAHFEPPAKREYGEVRTQAGIVQVRIDARIRRA